jgi:DNA topoisomerase IB
MGSSISSHAGGSLFMRLDSSIFKYTYDPTWASQNLYFKFQSVNRFGNAAQDLSTLTAVQFTVPGLNPGTIDASSGLVISGNLFNVGNGPMQTAPVATL